MDCEKLLTEEQERQYTVRVAEMLKASGMMAKQEDELYGFSIQLLKELEDTDDILDSFDYLTYRITNSDSYEGNYEFGSSGHVRPLMLKVMESILALLDLYRSSVCFRSVESIGWLNYLFKENYKRNGFCVEPIPTHVYLGICQDDMIPLWTEGCDIQFSEETKEWFSLLRTEYNRLIDTDVGPMTDTLKYVMGLIWTAEGLYSAHTFESFFNETINYLHDKRYLVLWRLFGALLHNDISDVTYDVFVNDTIDCSYCDGKYSRVPLQRYMALVANKSLRKKVFGF